MKDKYVYLRIEGIRQLLNLVRSLNEQEEVAVFLKLQNHKETNSMFDIIYIYSHNSSHLNQTVSLHILAFILQNLPSSFLDQALKPFPRVCLKDDPTPTATPRNLSDSGNNDNINKDKNTNDNKIAINIINTTIIINNILNPY